MSLHDAVRYNDLKWMKSLLEQGVPINGLDHRYSSPLHLSLLCKNNDITAFLLSQGADVNQVGYNYNTPLHFAIMQKQYDIIPLLIEHGANIFQENYFGHNALEGLFNVLNNHIVSEDVNQLTECKPILETLVLFAKQANQPLYFDTKTDMPLSVLLIALATMVVKEKNMTSLLLEYAHQIAKLDASHDIYLNAKNLLHVFPTGKEYPLIINNKPSFIIEADAHLPIFTNQLMLNSVQAYLKHLLFSPNFDFEAAEIFRSMQLIFSHSLEFATYSFSDETAVKAWQLYQARDIILLPSGWQGHYVTLLITKELIGIGNNGQRHPDDPAGMVFYKAPSEKLDFDFFKKVLQTPSQIDLEFGIFYNHDIGEKIYQLEMDNQAYGNCSWESQRIAVMGLIFTHLLKEYPEKIALQKTQTLFQEWDDFHHQYQLELYQRSPPSLPQEALLDILDELNSELLLEPSEQLNLEIETFENLLPIHPKLQTLCDNFYAGDKDSFLEEFCYNPIDTFGALTIEPNLSFT